MIRVDFYLLDKKPALNRANAACQIASKIHKLGHKSQILAQNEADARKLDSLLWTFHPGSFVPHTLQSEEDMPDIAVLIGSRADDLDGSREVLISLQQQLPEGHQQYPRIVEIVGNSADEKQQARARYRQYKDKGYELHTHEL